MKTNKLVKQALENSYAEICDMQQRIAALHYALKPLRDRSCGNDEIKEDFSKIHCALFRELNDKYRHLFMFSVVSGDKEIIAKAKKLAFDRFLTERSEIVSYLGFNISDSNYCDLEVQFRDELDSLKKIKKEKGVAVN